MTMDRLIRHLDDRAAAGRPARLWLRDDDAVAPSPALDRLLALSAGSGVPLTLAVIPSATGEDLARRLDATLGVSVAVHGWSHANHAPPGDKPQELGPHRPAGVVLTDLSLALGTLAALHPSRLVPMLVPPWNRIAAGLLAELPQAGFSALSVFGAEGGGPLPQVNTHVDLIDWRGTRGGHPADVLAAGIVSRLSGAETCGILTHHLVHDDTAWAFLDTLFQATAAHPGAQWVSVSALIP